jgi:hypothetical protein
VVVATRVESEGAVEEIRVLTCAPFTQQHLRFGVAGEKFGRSLRDLGPTLDPGGAGGGVEVDHDPGPSAGDDRHNAPLAPLGPAAGPPFGAPSDPRRPCVPRNAVMNSRARAPHMPGEALRHVAPSAALNSSANRAAMAGQAPLPHRVHQAHAIEAEQWPCRQAVAMLGDPERGCVRAPQPPTSGKEGELGGTARHQQ